MRGYKEEGTTTTPFDMAVLNDLDRFHLVERRDRPRAAARRAGRLRQAGDPRQADRAPAVHRRARRRHAGDRATGSGARQATRAYSTESDRTRAATTPEHGRCLRIEPSSTMRTPTGRRATDAATWPRTQTLLEQYGCGPVAFTGTDDALYERHLLFDHVVDAAGGRPARALRGRRPLRPRPARRSAGCRPSRRTTGQNPKRVYYLSMEFLIGRSLANNVINLLLDPLVAAGRASEKHLDWLELARAGARRRPGQRRPRAAGGLLPRLAGHAAAPGHGLRPALRVRHLPAGDRGRLAARAAGQLAAPARPVGGRPPGRDRSRSSSTARSSCAAASLRAIPGQPSTPDRHPVRPARRRLRRQDDQHAAAVGGGRARLLRLPASSASGDFVGAVAETLAAEIAHPRALSRRLHQPRAGRCASCRSTSWSPARWPTSCAASAAATTTGARCPTRSPSSSTTRTRRWPSPS